MSVFPPGTTLNRSMSRIVHLNIGGVMFMTTSATLLESDSYFSALLQSSQEVYEFFIDRDPTHFRHVLNWMRGVKALPEDECALQELRWEADFFCMHEMRDAIIRTKSRYSIARSLNNIHTELRRGS